MKLILCALPIEFSVKNSPENFLLRYTGVGKMNAALCTDRNLSRYQGMVSEVINIGTAVSYREFDNLGKIVECGVFYDRDNTGTWNPIITNSTQKYAISSGDNFVTSRDNFNFEFSPQIVDMEAYAIASVCKEYNIPFRCFKYITDYVGENSLGNWTVEASSGQKAFSDLILRQL